MATERFDWITSYSVIAERLLDYKDRRGELVDLIIGAFKAHGIPLPKLDEGELEDIDPFTVMGLFNKSMRDDARIRIVEALLEGLKVSAPLPTNFDSIPVLMPLNATYYRFKGEREAGDIDCLWDLFESVLRYKKDARDEVKSQVIAAYDRCIVLPYVGIAKMTMGMYWVAPDVFMSIDSRNIEYIYKLGKIPKEVVSDWPVIKSDSNGETYFKFLVCVKQYLEDAPQGIHNLVELSYEAWRYSEEVRRMEKAAKNISKGKESDPQGEAEHSDDASGKTPYTKADFLREVFMTEEKFDDLVGVLRAKKNIILQGAPGVGKTFAAKRLAWAMMGEKDERRIKLVQFHQSYSYEDFVIGYKPVEQGFELRPGVFYKFCEEAAKEPKKDFFFIIDEINRGNLSKIFGELLMMIEKDYRGKEVGLAYGGSFSVPEKLYIIGMMNTADRSLALIDYALRRRFSFIEMEPGFDSEGFKKYQSGLESEKLDEVIDIIKNLNKDIAEDPSLGKGFCVGHSYFCGCKQYSDEWLRSVILYDILPMLHEYWFDEEKKVNPWEERLAKFIKQG